MQESRLLWQRAFLPGEKELSTAFLKGRLSWAYTGRKFQRLCSPRILLNGKSLELTGTAQLPPLEGKMQEAGTLSLAPASVTFLVLEES